MKKKEAISPDFRCFLYFLLVLSAVVFSGCGMRYVTPGAGAELSALAETDLTKLTPASSLSF